MIGPLHLIEALTSDQVAEALGCERQHVNELAAAGKLPGVKYGRSWRFPVSALKQYLAERALENVAPKQYEQAKPAQKGRGRAKPLMDLTQTVRVAA
ncbi:MULTISPECIES: helix-turn-helix domain-containing protein [Cupriavidus]